MSHIDLHCHTISCKKGDGPGRNVPSKSFFLEKLHSADVSVVAITNHNYFDINQFRDFSQESGLLVLPGIELDVNLLEPGVKGHLILISNPEEHCLSRFLDSCKSLQLLDKNKANTFSIDIQQIPELVSNLDCLLIAHYGSKAQHFEEEDVAYLKEKCSNSVFVEPSNLISAFIYIGKGLTTILGSDVKQWDNYPEKVLPELKVSIESFNALKLLLKKDNNLIKQKTSTRKIEYPFRVQNAEFGIDLSINIYRDSNVIIGGKSSGKTLLIKGIRDFLVSKGKQGAISEYFSEDVSKKYESMSKYTPSEQDLIAFVHSPSLLSEDFAALSSFILPESGQVFSKIEDYLKNAANTRLAKQLGFARCITTFPNLGGEFSKAKAKLYSNHQNIKQFLSDAPYKNYLTEEDSSSLEQLLKKSIAEISSRYKTGFVKVKANELATNCIKSFKGIFKDTKAAFSLPNTTGLRELYEKEKELIANAKSIETVLKTKESLSEKPIGFLDGKGNITFCSYLQVNDKSVNKAVKGEAVQKGKSKDAATICKEIHKVSRTGFGDGLLNELRKLAGSLKNSEIVDIKPFLNYGHYFKRENGGEFLPSKGEQSVLVLSKCLNEENPNIEFYLLDEPEMSVGHAYVNKYIIPRLKELAKLGKTIVVCTHDANIAVGTLPFQVIYREEENNGNYATYIGNPFTNRLIEYEGTREKSWQETVVTTLEGGREALNIREVTYGDRD